MADFRKVSPGDPVDLPAEVWNAVLDAARAEKARPAETSELSRQPEQGTIVTVKNETGQDLPRHSILGLTAPLFLPSASLDGFLRDVTFKGVIPQTTHKDRYAVTLDPLKAGAIGRAHVDGITPARIRVTDAAHMGCGVSPGDTTALVSTGSGTAAGVLWREGGTGTQWGLVRLDSRCDCPPTEPPPTGCCPGLETAAPTLSLSDELGMVPMIYNGPRPVSIANAAGMWWGCTVRSCSTSAVRHTSGTCDPASYGTRDVTIVFALWCVGPSQGYRLYMFHDGCGNYDDGLNIRTHIIENGLGCTTPWGGQYNQIVAGSINGLPAADCDPFTWGPYSQTFPDTYPQHPLRGIYGGTGTWTITGLM